MAPAVAPGVLAGRIQGFGNINPPPLEEEDAKTIAKRAAGRLGSLVGEELVLTVQDFREKGAVGAVKDAVFDAGDLLVDGVASVFGWIRGDPPPQEEADDQTAEDAQRVLTNAPPGAVYGVSQASPSGGINAVWVMPQDADPAMLAQLAAQEASTRTASGVQPYMPSQGFAAPFPYQPQGPMQLPGGPVIAPYEPAPRFGGRGPPPFVPSAAAPPYGAGLAPQWPGAGGFAGAPSGAPAGPAGAAHGVRALLGQVAQGTTMVGPEVAKRLLGQCASAGFSAAQLGEVIAERTRRVYLGLDGECGQDADGALARLLALVDALAQQDSPLARDAAKAAAQAASEELLSLQSSAVHRSAALPALRRLGLARAEEVDLLGDAAPAAAAPAAAAAQQVDLLDVGAAPTSTTTGDLLF